MKMSRKNSATPTRTADITEPKESSMSCAIKIGKLMTVRVDEEGKIIPSSTALAAVEAQFGVPRSVAAAARCHRLAVTHTLVDAWNGEPARYDVHRGPPLSWRRAAEIARELAKIAGGAAERSAKED